MSKIVHQSITEKPQTLQKCSGCQSELHPGIPRLWQVNFPDGEMPEESFWCDACQASVMSSWLLMTGTVTAEMMETLKEGRAA